MLASNKEIARAFLTMAAAGEVREAYEKFVAPNFIHHNQYFKGDRQSLLEAMEAAHRASPNHHIEIKFIYEDGATVITHSQVVRKKVESSPIVVIHIFRFENQRVVELWDVGQEVMKDSPNHNGMF